MALEQTNQPIRLWKRIGTWMAATFFFSIEVLKSFLNFKEGDGLLTKGVKTADTAARLSVYVVIDYALWLISIAIFTAMKINGFALPWIFVALWVYDFVAAGAFIVWYEETGNDLSLGENIRRATDTIHTKSRLVGYATMVYVVGKAIVWSGPERFVTYFRKEIGTIPKVIAVLLALTAFQALFWTVLYGLGYGLVVE